MSSYVTKTKLDNIITQFNDMRNELDLDWEEGIDIYIATLTNMQLILKKQK